jgi:hypothetical protein
LLVHGMQWASPSQTAPPLPAHGAPSGAAARAGVLPEHEPTTHGLLDTGTSPGSATSTTLPAPSHCAVRQSPAVCASASMPAGTKLVPQVPPVQARVAHGPSDPGQPAAVTQPEAPPPPSAPPLPPEPPPEAEVPVAPLDEAVPAPPGPPSLLAAAPPAPPLLAAAPPVPPPVDVQLATAPSSRRDTPSPPRDRLEGAGGVGPPTGNARVMLRAVSVGSFISGGSHASEGPGRRTAGCAVFAVLASGSAAGCIDRMIEV